MSPHRTTFRVRYGESDQMGVAYHANYVVYFELGRTEMMREAGVRYADMESGGTALAVTEVAARFLRPAHYDEKLVVETRLTSVSGVRVRFDYRILRPDEAAEVLLCVGHTVLGCIGPDGRPRRIPEPWRSRLAALREP